MEKLNLSDLKFCKKFGTKYEIADKQAEIVIKELNKKMPDIEWKIVDSIDTKTNLEMGDINGYKNGKLTYLIDLKVAEYNHFDYYGTIDLNSILHFSNKPNAIYLCCKWDGSDYFEIDGKKVWDRFNINKPCLIQTKHKTRNLEIRSSLEKYMDKFYIKPKDGVSPYDFIGTNVVKILI